MGKRLTQEEVFIKFKKIHGTRFDYSKFIYLGSHVKGIMICKNHGEFKQSPSNHLNGAGCFKCSSDKKKLTNEQFIKKAAKKHNNKYDYSNFIYMTNLTKGIIICSIKGHGEFIQQAGLHLIGQGCPKCSGNYRASSEELKTKIIELLKIHPNLTAKLWTKLWDKGIIDRYFPRTIKKGLHGQ